MLNSLGIVEFPFGGFRDAVDENAVALGRRKFGGKSLLEWVVRRVTDSQRLDGVVVVVRNQSQQRIPLEQIPPDVPIHVAKQSDPLACFGAALHQYPAKSIVRVSVDSPFVDPFLIDRLVNASESHTECDYISFRFGDGRPVIQSRLGVVAEWCRSSAIIRADREATDRRDREDVTRYLYSHPEIFSLRLLPVPTELDRDDLRLTIDVDEDFENAQEIYEALGPESLDWQRIAGLLDQQPAIRERMAYLNRRRTASGLASE